MAYTTIKKPSDYFNTVLYTGDGTSPRSITGVGFQPDLLWIKDRSTAYEHRLMDAVRGSNKVLHSSTTGAETSEEYYTVSSFDSDGWTGRNGTGTNQTITGGNDNGDNFVAWNWLGANGTASNTDGSITSTVSANTTSGFSIVKYTGTGSNATIGHGLGVKPNVIILKSYENAQQWSSYWSALGATKYMRFNTTDAAGTASNRWNNTEPTTSVFTVSTDGEVNTNGQNQIAYCFAEKQGYSKFGSYTGNGSTDGTFIYTGFKPAYLMVKRTDVANEWQIQDAKRNPFNPTDLRLTANTSNAELTGTTTDKFDFVSNGIKIREDNAGINASGGTYIYMAFAESPLVAGNYVPTTAR